MGLSIWQIAVVAILVILLFGRGKLSGLMTDRADGIKSFREGIKDSPPVDAQPAPIADQSSNPGVEQPEAAKTVVE